MLSFCHLTFFQFLHIIMQSRNSISCFILFTENFIMLINFNYSLFMLFQKRSPIFQILFLICGIYAITNQRFESVLLIAVLWLVLIISAQFKQISFKFRMIFRASQKFFYCLYCMNTESYFNHKSKFAIRIIRYTVSIWIC